MAHPTNNPKLVSYNRPELTALTPALKRAKDCWSLLPREGESLDRSPRAAYLPKESGEPQSAYQGRLQRSSYPSIYRDSIRSFAGLLSRFQLIDEPESFERSVNDIDMRGSSLRKFLTDVDQHVLRDGAAAILVEMPPEDPSIESKADEIRSGRRPYLVLLERDQVINWRSHLEGGREILDLVIIKIKDEVADGDYGVKNEDVYIVMVPGAWRKVKVKSEKNKGWSEEVVEEGATSLSEIPIAWVGSTTNQIGQSDVVMDGLAQLSIEHMQLRSDLAELIHKCALPAGVRVGDSMNPDGSYKPLTIGPNSVLDLPEGGDFKWAEINGGSLQRHQEEVQHVEALMKDASLSFLWGDGNGQRTATEVALASSQVSAQIRSMIEAKMSAIQKVLQLWSQYTGENITDESGITMNDSLISKPLDSQDVSQLVSMFNNNIVSHRTTLEELQRGGILDPDMDVDQELAQVHYEMMDEDGLFDDDNEEINDPANYTPDLIGHPAEANDQAVAAGARKERRQGMSVGWPTPTFKGNGRVPNPAAARTIASGRAALKMADRSPWRRYPQDR